eukprot:7670399-Alexandrium_andersonii.AAC.1
MQVYAGNMCIKQFWVRGPGGALPWGAAAPGPNRFLGRATVPRPPPPEKRLRRAPEALFGWGPGGCGPPGENGGSERRQPPPGGPTSKNKR